MTSRQWALVRASRVADRSLQRVADSAVAVLFWACRLGDKNACHFANVTHDTAEDEAA